MQLAQQRKLVGKKKPLTKAATLASKSSVASKKYTQGSPEPPRRIRVAAMKAIFNCGRSVTQGSRVFACRKSLRYNQWHLHSKGSQATGLKKTRGLSQAPQPAFLEATDNQKRQYSHRWVDGLTWNWAASCVHGT